MQQNLRNERLGICKNNNQGLKMEIIDYIGSHRMIVKFEDGTVKTCAWKEFNKGCVVNPNYRINDYGVLKTYRLGEEKYNKQGSLMKIVKYVNANEIYVQFNNNPNNIIKTEYQRYKRGNINDPFVPTVYGVGITGNTAPCMDGNIKRKEYRVWQKIIERCYAYKDHYKNAAYTECIMSDEFLYYPNFFEWITHEENYDVWKNNTNFAIDKDILCKGNKIYDAKYCCLVPTSINSLIISHKTTRGKYLIGVTTDPHDTNKYLSQCWNGLLQKNVCLGSYADEHDAFMAYKEYKENLIKETAEKVYQEGLISKKCYEALINYEIEITD